MTRADQAGRPGPASPAAGAAAGAVREAAADRLDRAGLGQRMNSPTEDRNPRTTEIDRLPTLALLERLNDEDGTVAAAVRAALPELAVVVDAATGCLRAGGRVHYFGGGTSGRIAFLDAAELAPTFGLPPGTVVAHIAGGERALIESAEDAEDDEASGAADAAGVTAADLAIGVSASGSTAYVGAALRRARAAGAPTALLSANPAAPLRALADVFVCADTGAEAIAGSTRLKAGTAEKLLLNAFSTALMVRAGRTFSNLMVHMTPVNAKLRARQVRMLEQATGRGAADCVTALDSAAGDVKVALVALLSGAGTEAARAALDRAGGVVRDALGLTWAG
jgi:N-acetylmuramic acid 6-phosphate etherase